MNVFLGSTFRELQQNWNTPTGIIILYVFTNSLATSIWMYNAWTPYIYQTFGGSNFDVGLMSAINGTFQMIFAIVAGHLADKVFGPSTTLLFSVRLGSVALIFIILSVQLENWIMLILSQVIYGIYAGLSLTCVESVFAQCIEQGDRDRMYGVKFSLEAAGPIGGLLLSLILFSIFGNAWRTDVLRWVIFAGTSLHIISMQTFLFRFNPLSDHIERSMVINRNFSTHQENSSNIFSQEEPRRTIDVEEEIITHIEENVINNPILERIKSNQDEKKELYKKCLPKLFYSIPLEKYPYIVAISDVVTTLGSGMTTQYFSLFMMNIYSISPIGLTSLGLMDALLISLLAIVNSHLSKKYGRTRMILFPKLGGSFLLLYMALARETYFGPTWMMCIVYVIRMALMNCTTGLSRALIMDIVSEEKRGMWNAVESIQSASWSGTALFGGYLADKLGYGAAFIVTFAFHLASCIVIIPCTTRNDTDLSSCMKENISKSEGKVSYLSRIREVGEPSLAANDVAILNVTVIEETDELTNKNLQEDVKPTIITNNNNNNNSS